MKHISIQKLINQTPHISNLLKHFININNHQANDFNRFNNINRDVNAKISSSQVHAEFLKIVLRKGVL